MNMLSGAGQPSMLLNRNHHATHLDHVVVHIGHLFRQHCNQRIANAHSDAHCNAE